MTEIRAAIYARYSSDKQNDRSIEDHSVLCHALCERDGLLVIELCADRALSPTHDDLGREETGALWVSEIGTMLELATRIRKHTKETFGASLPPHSFHDAAATSIAVEDPRHVCDAHHILGNTLATTQKYYHQAHSLEESRRHQARSSSNGRRQGTR
jgi:hypothetical protein